MAILSTFDPKLWHELLIRAEKEFWKDNIVLVKKSRFYIINVVLIPFILVTIAFVFLGIFFANVLTVESIIFKIIAYILWWVFLLICIQLFFCASVYYMDFILVTPQTFTKNKQNGLFKRDLRIVDLDHIKSVHVQKKWLFQSVFDVGGLVISLDWWDTLNKDDSNLRFRYVRHPEKFCEKIEYLLRQL